MTTMVIEVPEELKDVGKAMAESVAVVTRNRLPAGDGRAVEPGPFHNFPESFNQQIFGQGTRTVTPNFWQTAKPD